MLHDKVDIDRWKSEFALARLRAEASQKPNAQRPSADSITGPRDLAIVEQLRDEVLEQLGEIECVPTDVFIWSRGEPENRAVTKIGGLPYREANIPWPRTKDDTPLNFVAQINFMDSRDIYPNLPGDILLLFIEGKRFEISHPVRKDQVAVGSGLVDLSGSEGKLTSSSTEIEYDFMWGSFQDNENSQVIFEWVTIADFPLVSKSEMPRLPWNILPCYGTIHRTWDYPTLDAFAYQEVVSYLPNVLTATKIGGICPWIQEEEDIPGSYLCAINSIFPAIYQPYGFLNLPEPIISQADAANPITWMQKYDQWYKSPKLMIGDCGMMYLFINSYGDVRWTAQGH